VRRFLFPILCGFVLAACSLGAEVRFPIPPTPVVPQPKPDPSTIPKLTTDLLYIFESDTPLIALSSPAGLVKIVREVGPLRVRGKFIDGNGKTETRTYNAKNIFLVEVLASGRVELLAIPEGAKTDVDVQRVTLDVDAGDSPRPPPIPPVPPPDPPSPAPIPVAGFRVLIVYESGDLTKMPAAQQAILYSKTLRDYLNVKCVAGPDSKTREWRIFDKDVDTSGESAVWQAVMKRPRSAVPWIVISDGKAGHEGPLPATVDETLALLKKWGGS